MARIRNIKPDTFDDPDLGSVSLAARWVFVGLWTQADRDGRMEDDPRRLKVRLMPYDKVNFPALLDELAPRFIARYAVDGKNYIQVNNFARHQRFHKDEKATGFPPPPTESSGQPGNFPAKRTCISNLKSEIGNRKSGKGREPLSADADPLAALWNAHTTKPIPRCIEVTPTRAGHIKARREERTDDEWVGVVKRIEASAFCRGQNDRGWVASFDWLIESPNVAVKVLEGKYDNRTGSLARTSAPSLPAYNPDWCQHEPRCNSRDWHAVIIEREGRP